MASSDVGPYAGHALVQYLKALSNSIRDGLRRILEAPSHSRRADARRRQARHMLWFAFAAATVIGGLMLLLDVTIIKAMPPRGSADVWLFRIVTDFGKASYVVEALLGGLAVLLLVSPRLRGSSRLVVMGCAMRVAFVLLAVVMPLIVSEIVKVAIGRGRPFVGGAANAFYFSPFATGEQFASFPSSHAVVAFALAFAVSCVWPRAAVPMAIYALAIGFSRVVLLAHHPSDVVAGALIGILGAMTVRYWFAARHLVFTIGRGGLVQALPGPPWERLKRVAREAIAP